MTKAASEAKGVAAETKEAEKLAASAAKSAKPKDEVALKKGGAGNNAGTHLWVAVEPDLVGFRFVGDLTSSLSQDPHDCYTKEYP